MIGERTVAGLERPKREGKTLGRKKVINEEIASRIGKRRSVGYPIRDIASEVGVRRQNVPDVPDVRKVAQGSDGAGINMDINSVSKKKGALFLI